MSDERERRGWIRTLGIPMIAAAGAMAAALVGTSWLMAAAIACVPGVGLAALLYLTFTSDLLDARARIPQQLACRARELCHDFATTCRRWISVSGPNPSQLVLDLSSHQVLINE